MAYPTITHIKVTNRNPFAIVDRYDNEVYTFPRGVDDDGNDLPERECTRTVPADVATHIFGYSPTANEDSMFLHCEKRFGWNQLGFGDKARDYFDAIDIKPVLFRLIEVPADEEPIPGEDGTVMPGEAKRTRRGRPAGFRTKRVLTPPQSETPEASSA